MREDGRDGEAAGALDVHEEGARARHEGLVKGVASMSVWLILRYGKGEGLAVRDGGGGRVARRDGRRGDG